MYMHDCHYWEIYMAIDAILHTGSVILRLPEQSRQVLGLLSRTNNATVQATLKKQHLAIVKGLSARTP